jgi:hypothetical protein
VKWMAVALLCLLSLPLAYGDLRDLGICENSNGTFSKIEKLVCESTPAFIESMNPGLKIPKCSDEKLPTIHPGHLPTSAVFVTCTGPDDDACIATIESFKRNKTGATLNVILHAETLKDTEFVKKISKQVSDLNRDQTPINFIPVTYRMFHRQSITGYPRDSGYFQTAGGNPVYVPVPQSTSAHTAVSEAMAQCGYPQLTDHFISLMAVDDAYGRLVQDDLPEIVATSHRKIQTDSDVRMRLLGLRIEGGNLMALPGGGLVVGHSEGYTPEKPLLDIFENQKIAVNVIDIPNLRVAHLDEIFSFVPSKDKCGFAILRASPEKMREVLNTHPNPNENLYVNRRFFNDYKDKNEKIKVLMDKADQLKERIREKPNSPDEKNQLMKIQLQIANWLGDRNYTVKETLNNKEIQAEWTKIQTAITESTRQIFAKLKLPPGCNQAQVKVVDVPVLWIDGEPKMANPINGLNVNGKFFYSKVEANLFEKWRWHEESSEYKPVITPTESPYIEGKTIAFLREAVEEKDLIPVSTQARTLGKGNLHCATLNVHLPCKN